jgi:hypothetical protein
LRALFSEDVAVRLVFASAGQELAGPLICGVALPTRLSKWPRNKSVTLSMLYPAAKAGFLT